MVDVTREVKKAYRAVCSVAPGRIPYHPREVEHDARILVAVPGDTLRDLAHKDRFGRHFDFVGSSRHILDSSLGMKEKKPRWCLLYRKHLRGSVGVRFDQHEGLLPKRCYIPDVHEVVAGIITHKLITGDWLFETPVRTSTKDRHGHVVCVGSGEDGYGKGIYVFSWFERGHGAIGCAIARKPKGKA